MPALKTNGLGPQREETYDMNYRSVSLNSDGAVTTVLRLARRTGCL